MMRPETRIRIYYAAEDWVQGLRPREIQAKYNISAYTYYEWKKTDAWDEAVGGRERQERPAPARYNRFANLPVLKSAAIRWVKLDKPPLHEYAEQFGIPAKELEKWAETPFWEATVLYAEHEIARERKRKARSKPIKPRVSFGKCFPMHLFKQAVFLSLAGWPYKRIGEAVNRDRATIADWALTDEWKDMQEELMLDKLMMHMLDTGMTIQQMVREAVASRWK